MLMTKKLLIINTAVAVDKGSNFMKFKKFIGRIGVFLL